MASTLIVEPANDPEPSTFRSARLSRRKRVREWVFVVIATTLMTAGALAAPGRTAAQGGRVVVVDVARVLAKSAAGVAAREQLEREKAGMQKAGERGRQEGAKLKEEVGTKGALSTD